MLKVDHFNMASISTGILENILQFTQEREQKMDMYEFRLTVSWEGGGDQLFIINVQAGNAEDAKDQVGYLVKNKLEVLALAQIKVG
ncbi:MAG: hypothetical protein HN402_07355 [Candidatus Scalindua sp.]|jgi:hypothetical protein|nr:hypothetical protein [Candidatus Scalindua sp.]